MPGHLQLASKTAWLVTFRNVFLKGELVNSESSLEGFHQVEVPF